jgi:hypothetical protein
MRSNSSGVKSAIVAETAKHDYGLVSHVESDDVDSEDVELEDVDCRRGMDQTLPT